MAAARGGGPRRCADGRAVQPGRPVRVARAGARRRQRPRVHAWVSAARSTCGSAPTGWSPRGSARSRFATDSVVRFRPGQWIELHVPHSAADARGSRRVFSLATPPDHADGVAVAFRLTDAPSSFKQALSALPEGGLVRATGVGGDFLLPRDPTVPLLLVAGGIGITPFVSQLAALARTREQRDVVVVLLVGPGDEPAYTDVLTGSGARVVVVEPRAAVGDAGRVGASPTGPTLDATILHATVPTPDAGSRTSPGDRAWSTTRAASCAARASAGSARTRSAATDRRTPCTGRRTGWREPGRRRRQTEATTRATLWPPKPNELLIAAMSPSRQRARGLSRTRSRTSSGSGLVDVDRRRCLPVVQREDREDRLERAGAAEQVARSSTWSPRGRRGRRRRRAAPRIDARLDEVADHGRRRVRVDVHDVDARRPRRPSSAARIARDLAVARRLGGGDVVAVGGQADAGDPGVDARAAGRGVLGALQDDDAGALADARSRRGRRRRGARRPAGSSLRSDSVRDAANAAIGIGWMAASVPPATTTSARPVRIISTP